MTVPFRLKGRPLQATARSLFRALVPLAQRRTTYVASQYRIGTPFTPGQGKTRVVRPLVSLPKIGAQRAEADKKSSVHVSLGSFFPDPKRVAAMSSCGVSTHFTLLCLSVYKTFFVFFILIAARFHCPFFFFPLGYLTWPDNFSLLTFDTSSIFFLLIIPLCFPVALPYIFVLPVFLVNPEQAAIKPPTSPLSTNKHIHISYHIHLLTSLLCTEQPLAHPLSGPSNVVSSYLYCHPLHLFS